MRVCVIERKYACPIPSCRKEFILNKTKIAPVTVVGPTSVGNLGGNVWVCEVHWRDSTAPADDDDFCSSAVLSHEASELDARAGLHIASQTNVPKVKRALFTRSRESRENSAKESGGVLLKETTKVPAGAKVVSGESSQKASDDIDSDTVFGRSDEEK